MKLRILIIIGVAILIYGYAVTVSNFVEIDDFKLIVSNPLLQGLSFSSIWGVFSSYDPDLYIPLTLLSYHLDRIIAGGFNPLTFHVSNLVLHVANAVCVFFITKKLSKNMWIGFATGILFAVHPLHTEAVMWISARKDLLSTFFFLISWILYLKGSRISIVMFALALMSKVSVIGFPILLILSDWYQGKRIDRASFVKKAPYFLLSIFFGIVAMEGMEGEASNGIATLLLASKSALFYLQKLFVPTGLSIIVPYYGPVMLSNVSLIISFMLLLSLSAFILLSRKTYLIFSWLFFLLFLIPSFGNFVRGNEYPLNIYLASDRYAYISSIGIIFAVSILLHRFAWKNAALSICVLCLSALSFSQSQTWKDTPSVLMNVLEHYPNSHIVRNSMAKRLRNNKQEDLAINELKKSIESKPNAEAYYYLGLIAENRKNIPLAREVYQLALEINPYYLNGYIAMAKISISIGSHSDALIYLNRAETYYPENERIAELRFQIVER